VRRPCLDTPEWQWISSFPARPGGKRAVTGKLDLSDDLARRAWAMHEGGDTWPEVAEMVAQETGARMSTAHLSKVLLDRFSL